MKKQREAPVLIMGGGTGGHVFPGLAVAEALYEKDVPVEWLGTMSGIESRVVPMANIPLHFLPVSGIRGKGLLKMPQAIWNLLVAQWKAIHLLRKIKPRSVLGMGGFVSGPGGLAAFLLGIPLIVHEQNAVPGTTNRLLSKIAKKVLQAFPDAFAANKKAKTVGNPIRKDIVEFGKAKQANAKVSAKANGEAIKLLVLGGSLGAKAINEAMPDILKRFANEQRPKVRHQSGRAHVDSVRDIYRQSGLDDVVVIPFIDDMKEAYAWADIVICRAGALTVSELCVANVPAILIPLPNAIDDHQRKNAQAMESVGAAIVVEQSELSTDETFEKIESLLSSPEKMQTMSQNCNEMASPYSAIEIAQLCLEISK